jgi:hypothetical protein
MSRTVRDVDDSARFFYATEFVRAPSVRYQRAPHSFAITLRPATKQVLISTSHHYNVVSLFRMMSARSVVSASRNSHAEFIAKYFSRHDISRINRHAESAMTPVLLNQGKVT